MRPTALARLLRSPLTAERHRRPSFLADLQIELGRLFRAPRAELTLILINAFGVAASWLILPTGVKDWLFSNLHGPLAFGIVLESWLLADVTSTNLFAHEPQAAVDALQRVDGVRQLVRVKVAALALLIGVPCAAIAAITVLGSNEPPIALLLTPVFLAVPFGALAIACWLGVALPYRVRSLRWRWMHRRPWVRSIRWLVLILVPYWLGGAVVTALVFPPRLFAAVVTGSDLTGPPPTSATVVMMLSACLASAIVFSTAPMVSNRLARARRDRLVAYLRDPDSG